MELVQEKAFENAQETDKQTSGEIVKYEKLESTPFTIVSIEKEHFGAMGMHRITDIYETKEEVKADLEKMTWDRVVQVIWAVVEKVNLIKKENE